MSLARTTAADSFRTLRDGRVELHPRLRQAECKTMQEDARRSQDGESAVPAIHSLLKPLTARQLTAIHLLTLGKSVVATAATLKVDPSTIHRWKSGHPLFIAELNRRQHDVFDQLVAKLRLLLGSAVDELMRMMKSTSRSERQEVMWKMLSFIRPQKLLFPTGPTEPAQVIDERIRLARADRGEIAEAPIEEEDRIAWLREQERYEGGNTEEKATAEAQSVAEEEESERDGGKEESRVDQPPTAESEVNHGQVAHATAGDREPVAHATDGGNEKSTAAGPRWTSSESGAGDSLSGARRRCGSGMVAGSDGSPGAIQSS